MGKRHGEGFSRKGALEEVRAFERVQSAAREWSVDVELVRPCVAQIRAVEKGRRDRSAYILATEFRRMGVIEERAHALLVHWNQDNLPPLGYLELGTVTRSAYRRERVFGCNTDLSEFCIGKDRCDYYCQWIRRKRRVPGRTTAQDFVKLGWVAPHVTPAERLLYDALVQMESIRGVGPGGRVITSTRQLARLAVLSPSGVLASLRFFREVGLIEYTPGRPRATGLPPTGCTIHRTIPIPRPTTRNLGACREIRRLLRSRPEPELAPLSEEPCPSPGGATEDIP